MHANGQVRSFALAAKFSGQRPLPRRNAQTLADYALNSGQLPDDTHIFEEIDLLTQATERSEARAIAPLVVEMQKVCKKANVTVEQLARRETRLGRMSARMGRATPYLIGFMSLLLTLYLVFQSSELHKADLALREYQDLASERLQEKIYNAWKMYRYERVLNVKAPPLAQLDGYQQLISDAKRLYEKRSAVQDLLLNASVTRYAPGFLLRYWPEMSMADGAGAARSPELTKPVLDCSEEAVAPVLRPPVESAWELLTFISRIHRSTCRATHPAFLPTGQWRVQRVNSRRIQPVQLSVEIGRIYLSSIV